MNKDLPIIIKRVFTNPDPIIWKGIWLSTLDMLLKNPRMLKVWLELLNVIKSNYNENLNMPLNQYIKWELKAFVAQIVNLRVKNKNMDDFTDLLQGYLANKKMVLKNELIHNVHRSINEN
tara:strand:- start:272 stop:631 length:360 start_codon:yes stop_codon:yes gene_type:complete